MLIHKRNLYNPLFVGGIFAIITISITIQHLLLKHYSNEPGGIVYTHYNNYLIFKQSFFHLIHHKDLYQLYPAEHWDYFKYSPTFALLMAPIANLPDWLGLLIWNLLNVLILFYAFWHLTYHKSKYRLFAFAFILIELITSVQNCQSNALMAGLIIIAFVLMERQRIALASLCIVLTIFIKIFGLIAFALFIFYPNKIKAALYSIGWILLLTLLPLIIVSPYQLLFQYQSWFRLLQQDHSASIGFSVGGFVYTWFGIEAKNLIFITGVVLFCIPLLKVKSYTEQNFRILFLSSILIWMVIFNHKAESPTFIIAVAGVAIWFFHQKLKTGNLILLLLTFVFTVLAATDIFPKTIRDDYFVPYVVKAVPCILVWIKINYELWGFRVDNHGA